MSTRAIIARITGDDFEGRYHHSDGYPSGLGRFLYRAWREQFGRDTRAMLRLLVDEHPAGWSSIQGSDLHKPAGYRERGVRHPGEPMREEYADLGEWFTAHDAWERTQGPRCYCHGDRHEEPEELARLSDAAYWRETWCEWAYALNEERPLMLIYKVRGDQCIYVTTVRLDADEPDWAAIEAQATGA